ncbi:polyprenyl synthetase superfamily protein [Cardiosporidium cionae]|uniref:Polyprenyl synthetase superfamily protein n=1 Tax=Cardiosporidium cionae TaxID=476202 RepID=A0ABQ7JFQ4_9APIC|nr:polyprenyl synthetase superfamily protein [Cardiosporidium cionae]|eukprot:KAF8822863.1 polyprenyl synthetase superfamily protein [Cardiosporidium cionae]
MSICSYYSATFGRGRPVRYDYHPLYVPSNINLWQPMYLPYASKSISGRAFAAALALFPRRSNNATSTTSAPLPSLELPSIEEIKPSGSPSIHVSSKGMPKALHASQAVHTATACTTPVKPLFIRKLGESWKNHCIRALKDSLIKQFFFSEELHEDVYAGIDILKSSTDREHINSQIQYIQDELEAFARNVNPFDLATEELKSFNIDLLDAVGSTYPEISNVSQYLLTIPGKRFRPLLAYLMNKTLATHFSSEQILQDGTYQHKMIEVAEMIHTASIMHDDVLDVADVRRGVPTANKIFDNKKAILGGDFLLARACRISASFGIPEMEYFYMVSTDEAFKIYLTKTYYKTAALMGETCACGALLGGFPEHLKEFSFKLGGVIGMAFQLYDDVLDFTSSSDALGKPVLNDIRSGVITSPVLLSALEHSHTLTPLIARKFSKEGITMHSGWSGFAKSPPFGHAIRSKSA